MKVFSKAKKWQPTSREEIRAFVGLLLNMGLVYKATTESYFCKKYFSQQMTISRLKLQSTRWTQRRPQQAASAVQLSE